MQVEYGQQDALDSAKSLAQTFVPSGTALTQQRFIDRVLHLQQIARSWAVEKGLAPDAVKPEKLHKALKQFIKTEQKARNFPYSRQEKGMKVLEKEAEFAFKPGGAEEAKSWLSYLEKGPAYKTTHLEKVSRPAAKKAATEFLQTGGPRLQEPISAASEFARTSRQLAPGGPPRFVR